MLASKRKFLGQILNFTFQYKTARALYQSNKRSKIINYFKSFDKINDNLTLNLNDKIINDDNEIAETFNTFFTSLDSTSTGNFEFNCVSENYIGQLLANLDVHTSPGISGIPAKVIKHSDSLVIHITKIINQSILNKTIPNEWKSAVVTPIYKRKGNKDDLNNYRGISVISPVAQTNMVFASIIHVKQLYMNY